VSASYEAGRFSCRARGRALGYGGKLLPSFPSWFIDGTKLSHMAWLLKERTRRLSVALTIR
jgi:hypothetical protein